MTVASISKSDCTGCKMCGELCPEQAIRFKPDQKGFWYPEVDGDRCVNCGLCAKRCPSLHPEHLKQGMDPAVYSAWTRSERDRLSSTSGGVFIELARHIVGQGGVVAGAVYDEDWRGAHHVLARTLEELERVKGSKYMQSDAEGIYRAVKEAADKGIPVLFCGTPCQIGGLCAYLGRDYPNLVLMDFVCRGVFSPKAQSAFLEELEERYGARVVEFRDKDKTRGWGSLGSYIRFANGQESLTDRNDSLRIKAYLSDNLLIRDCCFHCRYRTLPRTGADISVGDFWGIQGQTEKDMWQGISLVLLNTEKGRALFDAANGRLEIRPQTIEGALPGNRALLKDPVESDGRDRFFELLDRYPFEESVRQSMQKDRPDRRRRKMAGWKSKLKRAVRLLREYDTFRFIRYNFFCKSIVRDKGCWVLPKGRVVMDLSGDARIYLHGKSLFLGEFLPRGSREETLIRLQSGAVWNCCNGGIVGHGAMLDLHENAVLDSGYFGCNCGSAIIVSKRVVLGEEVMMGRNVIIYDSDFHPVFSRSGQLVNRPEEVVIGNHVWLTSNIMVQKGVHIGDNSLITAQTVVNKNIPPDSFGGTRAEIRTVSGYGTWKI